MTRDIDAGPIYVDRLPNGTIEAPQRYIDTEGKVIVRERFSTHTRFTKAGWDVRQRGESPYILGDAYCQPSEVLEAMNDELEENQFTVYYVDDGERVLYEVVEE